MKSIYLTAWSMRSTIVIAVLVLVASLLGLFSSVPYSKETENWLLQARGQDVGNILAVVGLLISAYLAKKGSRRGFLIWLGTLFYLLYAYIIYAVAVHFNSLFLVYVAILGLTFFTILPNLMHGVDHFESGKVNKFASYTLVIIGLLFAMLWLSDLIPATITGETPQSVKDAGLWVNPIHVLDLSIVLPAFIATGYASLKHKKLGSYLLAPWLTFSVLMGSSIVAAMAMMIADGYSGTVPPMVMVSAVVVASLAALISVIRGDEDEYTSSL